MIRCFRTITGDEILAHIIEEDEQKITFKTPIAMVQTPKGELAGVNWLQLADPSNDSYTIKQQHILIIYKPNQDVINNYRQQTGGIVTAPANVLQQLEQNQQRHTK